jgi:hypothetical protein
MENGRESEYPEDERPLHPIKDIAAFEAVIKKYHDEQHQRRLVYYITFLGTIFMYILYVSRRVVDELWETGCPKEALYALAARVYQKMLGQIILIWYMYIRLLRRSCNFAQQIDAQLLMLNVEFDGRRMKICRIRASKKMIKAVDAYRREERKRRQERKKRVEKGC